MPDENLEAASITEETTSQPESAPVEETTSEPSEPTEKSTNTTEEKMVPLTALQQERQKRKEAEEYIKSLSVPVEPEAETEERPQERYMTRDEYEFLEGERRRWQEVESKFPELKSPEIRELAEARRERALLKTGKYLTVEEAARQTVDILKKARSEGQKAAQESVSIQQREQVESTGSSVNKGSAESALETIRTSNNNDAKKAALLELLKNQ